MKKYLAVLILGLSILFNRGVMAKHSHHSLPPNWVMIQNEESGFQVEFPHHPLEMNIECPFQNTPPTGQVHFLSAPTSAGLLAFSSFSSPTFNEGGLQKEQLKKFFETTLVPHIFFNPAIFKDQQIYHFQTSDTDGWETASFQFSFKDHKILKRLEGVAFIDGDTLYVAFYMASDIEFDLEVYTRFLKSIQFPSK